ncbi:MAG: DciA family protein [Xanthomonadales bacterium]|nr:DciA family protein [Xanthomonadales bacterium]
MVRGQKLLELNRQLRKRHPDLLGQQAMLADVRDGRAVFLAPSSAWATRLRIEQQQLRSLLLELGEQAESVIVKVAMAPRVTPAPARLKPLSPAAAVHLQTVAASVSDPELRAQFLALASLAE